MYTNVLDGVYSHVGNLHPLGVGLFFVFVLFSSLFAYVCLFTFVGAYSHIGFSHPVVEQIAQPDNCYPSDHQQGKQMYENKIYDE